MIDERLATGARSALQVLQLSKQLRVVEELDHAGGEERLDLRIRRALVQVHGRRLASFLDLGIAVSHRMTSEALADPLTGVAIAVDRRAAIAGRDAGDLADDRVEIDLTATRARPTSADIHDDLAARSGAFGMHDSRRKGIGSASRWVSGHCVAHARQRR